MSTCVVVLADTHLRREPGKARVQDRLPAPAREVLAGADVILHAGDIVTADLLRELKSIAPVFAVRGNNDSDASLADLPELRVEVIDGVRVAMVHDSGPSTGREGRMHRRFPDAAVVVFGHSHIPWNTEGMEGQLLFNPGSPTQRRAQPHQTVGVLELDQGQVLRHEVVIVGP